MVRKALSRSIDAYESCWDNPRKDTRGHLGNAASIWRWGASVQYLFKILMRCRHEKRPAFYLTSCQDRKKERIKFAEKVLREETGCERINRPTANGTFEFGIWPISDNETMAVYICRDAGAI